MRLPRPIEDRPPGRRAPAVAAFVVLVAAVGAVAWSTLGGSDAEDEADASTGSSDPFGASAQDPTAGDASTAGFGLVSDLDAPARLLDTRAGKVTIDGVLAGAGAIEADATLEVPVQGRVVGVAESGLVSLTVTATSAGGSADLAVRPCGSAAPVVPSVGVKASSTTIRNLVVPVGANGAICLTPTAALHVAVDVDAFLDQGTIRPFPNPVRVVDTTDGGITADGSLAEIGVRPEGSTLRVPVSGRFEGMDDVGALVVSVTTVDPLEAGDAVVFAPESPDPETPLLEYDAEVTGRTTAIVPIGPSGELCVGTTGRTDVVVDLLALVPTSASPALTSTASECPGQTMFPTQRIVALYGTERSARLGILGEQDPAAAAARLDEIAEPWRTGDRPVLPAFELIATLATGTPEDRGVYNIRAEHAVVQEYLDVARRHGYYLILDLQPGQSDFLTEAQYYEEFLRQPDVGLALDPEWRTQPPIRPRGGVVGQVDAAEVNSVIDYIAQLVEEEGLPEKLLIVHQFQARMITNREQLREQPGVALTIHMDGFGERPNKLDSYEVVKVAPPLNMGLKLFFDEDTDLLGPTEVLGGLFDPVPDLVTYQ